MKQILTLAFLALLAGSGCNNGTHGKDTGTTQQITAAETETRSTSGGHWKGSFSNGLKGAKISFDIDGKELKELTFQGYWRCSGKLELTTLGPKEGFAIKGNQVDGIIKEQGFYFELHGNFSGNKASGTLRIAFVAGGCDTYKLNWTAEKA